MVRADFRRTLSIVILLAGLTLFAAPALADPNGRLNQSISTNGPIPTKPGEPARHWSDQTEATCGMACRYHRANDNLTMQALYLVTKIQKIEANLTSDEPNARIALGAFCRDTSEKIEDCFNRYKDFQRVALLDIRQAIGRNEDTIAHLTSGRKADGTVDDVTALAFETGEKDSPYVPDVPTLSDLEASYIAGKLRPSGQAFSRAEIVKWSESLIVNDPKAKFIQFTAKPVVGNPYQTEKSSHSLYMEAGDGSTRPTDDRAINAYRNAVTRIQNFAKEKSATDPNTKVIAPSQKLKDQDKISYDAFVQAHSVINSKIESDTNRNDADEKDRKVASEKDPNPKPGASGTPTIISNPNAGVARDVRVNASTPVRSPQSTHTYGPDDVVVPSPEMKNSRYIKYDVGDLMDNIDK